MAFERTGRGMVIAVLLVAGGCSVLPERTDESRESRPELSELTEQDAESVTPGAEREARQRETGWQVSAAAASLLASSETMLRGGDMGQALNLAQRAQRISPDSARVYYRLGRIYAKKGDYARAEQFVLKGLNKAGNDAELRESGWSFLAAIRASGGDEEGARKAREQAAGF
mgnify:CR=1 FL=1